MATMTQAQIEEAAKKFMNGSTIKELKGLTTTEMEAVYSLAFNFYRTGKFDDAEKLFNFLALFDHLNAKYWFGVGAVRQAKKNYPAALQAYVYASFLDIRDPRPQFHAAECYMALGDKLHAASAINALEEFVDRKSERGRTYLAKAQELKATIGEASFKELEELDKKSEKKA